MQYHPECLGNSNFKELTKREYFAAQFMAALITKDEVVESNLTPLAVKLADYLIRELNE